MEQGWQKVGKWSYFLPGDRAVSSQGFASGLHYFKEAMILTTKRSKNQGYEAVLTK